jgi:hypothetical protein
MKHSFAKIAFVALSFVGYIGTANALAQNATSIKYFDENGAIVGQFIRECSAITYHAGNTHTAYTITEATSCGQNPGQHYIVPNTIIIAYTLPAFLPISTACGIAECEPVGVAEPDELHDKGWTWTNP